MSPGPETGLRTINKNLRRHPRLRRSVMALPGDVSYVQTNELDTDPGTVWIRQQFQFAGEDAPAGAGFADAF